MKFINELNTDIRQREDNIFNYLYLNLCCLYLPCDAKVVKKYSIKNPQLPPGGSDNHRWRQNRAISPQWRNFYHNSPQNKGIGHSRFSETDIIWHFTYFLSML